MSLKKEKIWTRKDLGEVHTQRKDHVRTQGDDEVCRPRRKAPEETKSADTLALDFTGYRTVRK